MSDFVFCEFTTFDDGYDLPYFDGASAGKLAKDHFQKVERFANEQQNDLIKKQQTNYKSNQMAIN